MCVMMMLMVLIMCREESQTSDVQTSSSSSSSAAAASSKAVKRAGTLAGRICIYKSGRTVLRTPDGLVFEVSAGLPTSFAQCLVSLQTSPATATAASSSSSSSSSSASAVVTHTSSDSIIDSEASASSSSSGGQMNAMYVLGNVTKKIVLTPELFSNTAAAAAAVNGAQRLR